MSCEPLSCEPLSCEPLSCEHMSGHQSEEMILKICVRNVRNRVVSTVITNIYILVDLLGALSIRLNTLHRHLVTWPFRRFSNPLLSEFVNEIRIDLSKVITI